MRPGPALLGLMLLLASAGAVSADQPNRFWLMYEQGNAAASQKEFGQALQLYKAAIQGAGIFPEAEAAIGDIYLEEGEAALAQRQYEKAYGLKSSFDVPEMQYQVLYKLANLFEMQQQYKQMEDTLGRVTADDRHFQDTSAQHVRGQVEKILVEKGLDRVLVLYTYEDTFSAAAHSKLGWFYYRTGRYGPAVSQLLFSIIYRASEIKQAMLERDVDYQFSTVADMLAAVDRNADLTSYAVSAGLYKDLYYLAGAMFANGFPRQATNLWKALATVSAAGEYRDLSVRQLKKPFVEPLLTVTK